MCKHCGHGKNEHDRSGHCTHIYLGGGHRCDCTKYTPKETVQKEDRKVAQARILSIDFE